MLYLLQRRARNSCLVTITYSAEKFMIHYAAKSLRTYSLSITGAVQYGLKIQAFAARYVWQMACRETALIGNQPKSPFP